MKHAILQVMICMMSLKGIGLQGKRLSWQISQMSLIHTQPIIRWNNHRSVIFKPVSRHISVFFRRDEHLTLQARQLSRPIKMQDRLRFQTTHNYSTQALLALTKLKMGGSLTQKLNMNGKNHRLEVTKILKPATTFLLFHKSIYNYELVSTERAKQDEPSATNLAPNNGGNRRQSNGEGLGEQ
ncbi:hypothetical protein F511_12933 [Dorcoceras hygrometricum]|uniref:Uncharacterized protein n=1 Tax=Dorcoceras hygrometricum TaxID=472368 RepID=A0A2Z7D177_9LAMI|nr:hypothetical protein F511_12933 [Dorcoceras hygrometricum]